MVLDRPVGHECPDEGDDRSRVRREGEGRLRVGDGGPDLRAVAHDPGVGHQALDVRVVEAGHKVGIEAPEGGAIAGPLAQDGRPGQPGLRAFEGEHLEQMPLVARRDAPLLVVVGEVEGIAPGSPVAAPPSICGRPDASLHRRHPGRREPKIRW